MLAAGTPEEVPAPLSETFARLPVALWVTIIEEGFETAITVHAAEPYVAVQAKHRSGDILGTTEFVKL